jgi:uncharacterized protein (TIGR03643 family)
MQPHSQRQIKAESVKWRGMQYGLTEGQTIDLMRIYMKRSSFVMWRKRMTGLTVKHAGLRSPDVQRHRANNRSPSR